jgi:osmotically-inducible protein OsmY
MTIIRSSRFAVLACYVVLIVAAGVQTASAQRPAADIARDVQRTLSRERDLSRIKVSVADSEVTLSGSVPTLWAKREAIKRALDVDGVETVASELELPEVSSDASIAQQIGQAIRRYPYYTMFDYLDGVINKGVVTLTGSVTPDRDKAEDIENDVSRVRGVQEIRNQIVTLPPSKGDAELRVIIAYQLFQTEHFERFASQRDPPFHIIVHNSVVTLYGVVQSEIEYREMERIVRQTDGVLRVQNKLQKAS